jgi:hypothetical protein
MEQVSVNRQYIKPDMATRHPVIIMNLVFASTVCINRPFVFAIVSTLDTVPVYFKNSGWR